MALALDASSPAKATGTGTAVSTGAFTAPDATLLTAYVAYNTAGAASNDQDLSDSDGLAWNMQARKSPNAESLGGASTSGGVEIWTATTTSAVARTVTATQAGGSLARCLVVKVYTDLSAPTPGAIEAAHSLSGLASATVDTTADDSWVWAVASDYDQRGLGTAGSGQTISTADEHDFTGGVLTTHVWRQTATTPSPTAVTDNLTAPAAQEFSVLVFEILAVPPPTAPIVDISPDSWTVVDGTFHRIPVEDDTGDPITAREWKVMSGPAEAGNVVGVLAASTWIPAVLGSYVLRYTATNGIGSSFDEINLEVGGAIEGPQNSLMKR